MRMISVVLLAGVISAASGEASAVGEAAEQTSHGAFFADQFNSLVDKSIAGYPDAIGPAFEACLRSISVYQANIISRLQTDAESASSKTQQELLIARTNSLKPKTGTDQRVACAKQFLIALKIIPERLYYKDALILLDGYLKKGKEADIIKVANARLDDLTKAGLIDLAAELSLSKLNQYDLRMDMTSPLRDSHVIPGYMACLLPSAWVSWFNNDEYCHGQDLEAALAKAAQTGP